MNNNLFHSKIFIVLVLVLFIHLISFDVFSQNIDSKKNEIVKLILQGKEYFHNSEYYRALNNFFKAKNLIKTSKKAERTILSREMAEVYLHIAITYFALDESYEAEKNLKKLFKIQPEMGIEKTLYSSDFIDLFEKTKKEYTETEKTKEQKLKEVEKEEPVVREKTGEETKRHGKRELERKKFPWLIAGGVIVGVGGVAAALLLGGPDTGTIQVNSTPSGATVYLDGSDTGQVTNCTLSDVSKGSHTLKLIKEGYMDYEKSVEVKGGETETINVDLTANTIDISDPFEGKIWFKGFDVDIEWTTGGGIASGVINNNYYGGNSVSEEKNISSAYLNNFSPFDKGFMKNHRILQRMKIQSRKIKNEGVSERLKTNNGELISEEHSLIGRKKEKNSSGAKKKNDSVLIQELERQAVPVFPSDFNQSVNISYNNKQKDSDNLAITNVKIELYRGTNRVRIIASNTSNDGSYTWTVPKALSNGTNYSVRISCAAEPNVYGQSDRFEIKNFPKIDWINIPAGSFKMGDNFNEGESDETPVHNVYLDRFYISKYEITHEQFICFLNGIGADQDGSYNGKELIDMDDIDCAIGYDGKFYFEGSSSAETIRTPVIEVTWHGANEFCEWLAEKTGENILLPTEAQWEKAARGTDQRRYPWGNSNPNNNRANYNHNVGKVKPVGSYPAGVSPYGVHDMAGNVWELCKDWYDANYYSYSPSDNPQGPSSGSSRIKRGGSFTSIEYHIRSANRGYVPPSDSKNNIGFRISK